MDKAKLAKLLAMTTSTHDGEAINAMRLANEMILKAGLTWENVLTTVGHPGFTVTVTRHKAPEQRPYEEWVAPHLRDKASIDLMFRTIYAQPRTDNEEFWQFMDSIHERWTRHGNLTQKQYSALVRCYQKVRPR